MKCVCVCIYNIHFSGFIYIYIYICTLTHTHIYMYVLGFPGGSDGKESTYNEGDLGSIPGLRRSPGGGHGNPLQYSCLENPMHRGAWRVQSMRSQRVGHDWQTKHMSVYTHMHKHKFLIIKEKELGTTQTRQSLKYPSKCSHNNEKLPKARPVILNAKCQTTNQQGSMPC